MQAAETIPWGGAGLIVAYPRKSADAIDQAVTRALKKTVGEAEGSKAKALKAALASPAEDGSAGAASCAKHRCGILGGVRRPKPLARFKYSVKLILA